MSRYIYIKRGGADFSKISTKRIIYFMSLTRRNLKNTINMIGEKRDGNINYIDNNCYFMERV